VPPVDRNNPQRAASSESQYSLMEFMREFPDDAACLEWLWRTKHSENGTHAFCPKCERERKFHKVQARPAWDCDSCGYHLHPTAGTIFHKSSTSLHLWFYAMHLMTSTRCGISAKQIERELGVTYKTAWRMANLIRNELMVQDDDEDETLAGPVEMDEMYVGGRRRGTPSGRPRRDSHKTPVFGMVERERGRVVAKVVPDVQHDTIRPYITRFVLPSTVVYTDEYQIYDRLDGSYVHRRVHHAAKVYVDGDVHTNTIEGFWALTKNGIRGVYHNVSRKWLQGYLNEYAWRYNHRPGQVTRAQFDLLLTRAATRS
jgi:transposase